MPKQFLRVAFLILTTAALSGCPGPVVISDGGTGGGTGGNGITLSVIPPSATVQPYSELTIAATVQGAQNQTVIIQVESGLGEIRSTGVASAKYYAGFDSGPASVRVTAIADPNATVTIPIVVANTRNIDVIPMGVSDPFCVIGPGTRQTFAAAEFVSGFSQAVGFENISWKIWPEGTISNEGTAAFPATQNKFYVFANEPTTNNWASVEVRTSNSQPDPAVEITPAQATVAPNGVVQLTAGTSSGASVSWKVITPLGGTVSSSGLYTAPSVPGVYVVTATPQGSSPYWYGAATLIVK